MRHSSRDLAVVVAIVLAAGAAALMGTTVAAARAAVAAPLVLVVPGYALGAAALPGRALGAAARLTLSLGLSLAIVVLGGIVLNVTPWGLHTGSWLFWLGGTTLGTGAVALARRPDSKRQDSHEPPSGIRGRYDIGLDVRLGLSLALAATVAVGALAIARSGAAEQPDSGGTQLWILPANEGDPHTVRLGVNHVGPGGATYRLQMHVNGHAVDEWPAIQVGTQGAWEATVALPDSPPGGDLVEALLYRADAPAVPYRHVSLWRGGESRGGPR